MANTLIFANQSAVQARVEFHAFTVARYVITTEAPSVDGHWQRVKLANAVLVGVTGLMVQMAKLVLSNASIAAASPTEDAFLTVVADADILNEVNGSWTVFATAKFGAEPTP